MVEKCKIGANMGDILKFETVDDVLRFAIHEETKAARFYEELAMEVSKAETRKLLEEMAVQELEHRAKLEAVRAGEIDMKAEEVGTLHIAEYVGGVKPSANMSVVHLLKLAMSREQNAEMLYVQLAGFAKNAETKEMFKLMAQEEAKHKLRLEIEYDLATF